jgi:hypothetical protein
MTLLAPAAAIAGAAVTVPLLLVLYLLKLRRRPVRVSSILFWPVAKEDVQANVPLKWLRPSWLLFLHLLILASFVLALGRPVLTGGALPASRVVLLLDTSASMSAVDEGQTLSRLDLAKKRAMDIVTQLRRAGGRREVALVAFGAEARTVAGFTTSKSVIEDALAGVAPTDQPGSLAAALKLVDAIAAGAGEEQEQEPPTAILLSDGAFRDQGKLPASATRLRFERIGPPPAPAVPEADNTPARPQEGNVARTDNLGIVGLSARRDAQDPGMVRVFVDVLNTNAVQVPAPLSLSVNGEVVQRRAMDVPAAMPAGPGRASTIFELRNSEGGVVLASIGRADALAADNAAGLVLPPAQRPAILLVEPDAPPGKPPSERSLTAAAWILEDALTELRSRSFRSVSADEYERLAAAGPLAADLLVFDRVAPAKLPPVPSISFGAVPPGLPVSAGAEGGGTSVLFWQRSHPIMRNVALDAVVIAKSVELRTAPDASASVTELLRGRDGPLMVLVQEGGPDSGGVRRIVAGFDLAQSNWPLQAGFPIFLADAADYLTLRADAAAGRAFKSDEPVEVRVKPGSEGRVSLKGPVDVVLREAGQPATAAGVLSAGILSRTGIYIVEGPSALDRAVAVNLLDEVESGLASPETFEVAGRAVEGVTGASAPREVWDWLVLAGLVLLAVEWLVYARSVRT